MQVPNDCAEFQSRGVTDWLPGQVAEGWEGDAYSPPPHNIFDDFYVKTVCRFFFLIGAWTSSVAVLFVLASLLTIDREFVTLAKKIREF